MAAFGLARAGSPERTPASILETYLDGLREVERRGDAREESFYPYLRELILACAERLGRRDVAVTVIPRKTSSCLLDLQVWQGSEAIVGYVEAKRPHTDLGRAEGSEQVRRYLETFPNLLLTDFFELRLYRKGKRIGQAALANGFASRRLASIAPAQGEAELLELFDRFFSFQAPRAQSAASLARTLACRARVLAARVEDLLKEKRSGLYGYYTAFSEHLIRGLTPREFADLYAQTIAYGLLAARWWAAGRFDRRTVLNDIPAANGILRDAFRYISLEEPPPEIGWIVDDLIGILEAAPVREILSRYYREGQGSDPILHFYETFLATYDPKLREKHGVYYTPQPVVSYVVRSVHWLLRNRLGRRDGLADPAVTVLDPAAGTLTFLVEAFRCAIEAYREESGEGGVPALLRDHLLRNYYAFELMMAPYAIGHLKASLVLEGIGHPLGERERFQLFLTNALDRTELTQAPLPGMSALSRESQEAARVKREQRFCVVLGNPPYSGHSANRGKDFDGPLEEGYVAADGRRDEGYFRVDGRPLGERNPKWLRDDYVKFLRFAQRKVDENGEGIVGFVTSHAYLDNPTFRGMRRSLMESFDEIYLLDLHGHRWKGGSAPDGSPDENVFGGVERGVAIALFVKKPGLPKRIVRADLWGRVREKRRWLSAHHVGTTEWAPLDPRSPAYLFAPRDARLEEEYRRGVPLPEIFPEHSVGVVTARDAFAIGFDLQEVRQRVALLREGPFPEVLADSFKLRDTGSWRLEEARRRARNDDEWDLRFRRFLYRPFDHRILFYADYVVERPRQRIMRHMEAPGNRGLIVPRQHKEDFGALVTDGLAGHKAVSAYDVNYFFPLHLRSEGLLDRVPNVNRDLLRQLGRLYGEEPSPELLFEYVYAALYSPDYRRRYADLLRGDFARVPFPRERERFLDLATLGGELIKVHLLDPSRLRSSPVRFLSAGSGRLGRTKRVLRAYRPDERRVYVNEEGQCFDNLSPEVWAYRIGGYQVLDRWLQDRAGRRLGLEEIEAFRKIAAAIQRTLEVQARID